MNFVPVFRVQLCRHETHGLTKFYPWNPSSFETISICKVFMCLFIFLSRFSIFLRKKSMKRSWIISFNWISNSGGMVQLDLNNLSRFKRSETHIEKWIKMKIAWMPHCQFKEISQFRDCRVHDEKAFELSFCLHVTPFWLFFCKRKCLNSKR